MNHLPGRETCYGHLVEIIRGATIRQLAAFVFFQEKRIQQEGLPSVAYFADKCCYSAKYFGELVKTETGKNAKDFINARLLRAAQQLLSDDLLSITQISQRLGFEYPQHFVRFFKVQTGKTPTEYRKMA